MMNVAREWKTCKWKFWLEDKWNDKNIIIDWLKLEDMMVEALHSFHLTDNEKLRVITELIDSFTRKGQFPECDYLPHPGIF
jgi:hypothetical protein